MLEEDEVEYYRPYTDYNLGECLALTPDPMPRPKKPLVELKVLPKNLRYEFLDGYLDRPIIVNVGLDKDETRKFLDVLKKYHTALGYNISDLNRINPFVCMHRILLEEDSKASREHQRRIDRIMGDVVRREVLKLLEDGIIYPISDSQWVSPIHCVPKK